MRAFRRRAFPIIILAAAACALAADARAQANERRVLVTDSLRTPIPFALVTISGGASRVANDSGYAVLPRATGDSVKLLVRRMGFAPFEGWVRPDPGSGPR